MKFKEYIYKYIYNILFYSDSGFGGFVARFGPFVGDPWPIFWTSLGWAFALTSSWSKLASGGCPSQGQN